MIHAFYEVDADYTIVTICSRVPTENYYCLQEWGKSVNGKNVLVIEGLGNKYGSLCDKPKFVYRAIKQGIINTKYIIFCDCWDLVFATSPEEIILRFMQEDCDLIISSEKNCFPNDLKDEYDKLPHTTSYKYLNSGMIVGRVDALLETLEAMNVEEIPKDYWDNEKKCNVHFNDQFEYQKIFLKQPVKIKLDYEQRISQTLHQVDVNELDFSGARIMNKETRSFPATFHFNGSGKTDGCREPILQFLKL